MLQRIFNTSQVFPSHFALLISSVWFLLCSELFLGFCRLWIRIQAPPLAGCVFHGLIRVGFQRLPLCIPYARECEIGGLWRICNLIWDNFSLISAKKQPPSHLSVWLMIFIPGAIVFSEQVEMPNVSWYR